MLRLSSLWTVSLVVTSWCFGQTVDAPPDDRQSETEAAKKFQAQAQAAASEYELRAGGRGSGKCTRVPEPILRWANPLGGHRAHGEIFLWAKDGLPLAVLSINEFTRVNGKIDREHEWCSLSNEPLSATGLHLWSPQSAELSFNSISIDEELADSPTQRLRQMRGLATRFSGTKTTRAGEIRTLRLMPQPIYRYQSKDANTPDGGLFALVEATDPEALLIMETRRGSNSAHVWHYAFARLNSVKLTASLDGRQVWEASGLAAAEVYDRADKPYTAFIIK